MKTSIAHLPQEKQDDLKRIKEIILACAREAAGKGQNEQRSEGKREQRSEVGGQKSETDEQAAKPPSVPSDLRPLTSDLSSASDLLASDAAAAAPNGGVEMVILYGSNARGDAVYDKYVEDGVTYEYVSDYDVLIITDNDSGLHKNHAVWDEVRDRFAFGRPREGPRSAGLSLIMHTLHEVNKALEENRFFFADIQREGVLLYDSGRVTLAEKKEPTPEERKQRAREEFERWIKSSDEFVDFYNLAMEKDYRNKAAFLLHQVTEHLYTTILMVFTDYRPKLHDLWRLRKMAGELDRRVFNGFALRTKEQRHRFKLLADAYVHARYTKTYSITREELEYLAERVQKLRGIVEEVCRERIGT